MGIDWFYCVSNNKKSPKIKGALLKFVIETNLVAVRPKNNASGLVGLNFENGSSFGFLNPSLVHTKTADFQTSLNPAVDVLNFRYNF